MFKNAVILLMMIFCLVTTHSQARNFTEVVDDAAIATKLRFAFMHNSQITAKNIQIKVVSGVVTLEGYVDSQDQINQAIELAEKQKGVHEVKAYLVLKEFGQLKTVKERKSGNFFHGIFQNHGSKEGKLGKNKKDELSEMDLTDNSSPDKSDNKPKGSAKVSPVTAEKSLPTEAKYETQPTVAPNNNDIEPKKAIPTTPATGKNEEEDFKEFSNGY